ncbi:MAG: winged helix-turn-helix domain-containing protein [Pseudomonadales bacterium]
MGSTTRAFRLGDWLVDPELNQLKKGEETVSLQPKTMDVLVYLAQQTGPLSTEQLLDALWPDKVVVQAVIHQRIALIRRALGDSARSPRYIQTIPGRGYRLVAAVKPVQEGQTDSTPGAKRVVAILPFKDFSPGLDLGWLADGLRRHLERQIAVWSQFTVLPGGLVHDAEVTAPPQDADLLIVGFVQPHRADVELSVQVIDARKRRTVWSEIFTGTADDPYELQRSLVSSVARFFGESLGGWPVPSNPKAYAAFLRLLNYRLWGDADEHLFWLEQTLEADPSWAWGRADLAMALVRNAASVGNREMRARALTMLDTNDWKRDAGGAYACFARSYLLSCHGANPAAAERIAREWVNSYGFPYAMVLVVSGYAREALGYLRQASAKVPYDVAFLEWQAIARATLGDWKGAQIDADHLATFYPPGSVNPQIIRSWVRRGTPDQVDARVLCDFLRQAMQDSVPTSIQHQLTAHLGYYPLAFEVALAEGDDERARESIDWCVANEHASLAAIFSLRLDGAVPTALSRAAPNPDRDGFWWWLTRLHVTPEIARHPVVLRIESELGFTDDWYRELAEKASTLPPDRHLVVSPGATPVRSVPRSDAPDRAICISAENTDGTIAHP